MDFSATWQEVDLADSSAGDVVNDYRLNGAPLVQALPGLRAATAGVANRGNVTHTLSFTVTRPPFGTPLLAAEFQVDHAIELAAVTTNGDCTFSLGDRDFILSAAVVTRREVTAHYGTTVVYAYTVTGGALAEDV